MVKLYSFALVLQMLLLIPYFITAPHYSQTAHDVMIRLLDTLSYAAPPGLPSVLLLVGAVAQSRLKKEGLQLMFPESLKRGADIDVVCFDKTGTLTHSAVGAAGH